MATVLDSFDRSNRNLDGDTADSGQVWDVVAGTVEIVSNTARPTAGAPSATALLPFGDHDTCDLSVEISVSSGSANPAGLVFAALDNSNRLGVFLGISTQRASIFKADGGTTTELANVAHTIAVSTTYLVRVVRTGALIDMYVDGAGPVVSFTLTGGDELQYLASNGYTNVGVRGDTNAVFDDLTDNTIVLPDGVPWLVDELGADARLVVEVAFTADITADPDTWEWEDVTTDVRQDPGISTTLGRGDEASVSQPASCEVVLDNAAGDYSLGGESIRWPYVRQGTPVRVRIDPDDGDGPRVVLMGFAAAWVPSWDGLRGTVPLVTLTAAGALRRLEQGTAPVASALRRSLTDTASVVAYWPMEDGRDSTVLRAVTGGTDMTYTGIPRLGSSNTYNCSADIADAGSGIFTANLDPYTATGESQVRMLITVPEDGIDDGAILARVWTSGTLGRWDIAYATGGNLSILIYNSDGSLNDSVIGITFDMDGKDRRMSLELTQDGADVDWALGVIQPADLGAGSFADTIAGKTHGRVTQVQIAPLGECSGVLFGHLTVQDEITSLFESTGALRAHVGEFTSGAVAATSRLTRLCTENGVALDRFTGGASLTDADKMGPQLPAPLLQLVRECETADQGQIWDGRHAGITYTTRRYREHVTSEFPDGAALTIDVGAGELAPPFDPRHDDQRIRNKVTATRLQGVSATVEDTDGARGTAVVGTYDSSLTVNTMQDLMALQHAAWQVALGTGEDYRVPSVTVDLRATPALAGAVLDLIPGDRVDLVDVDDAFTAWGASFATVRLIVEGISHAIGPQTWTVTLACSPFSPWGIGEVAAETGDVGELVLRADTDGSTLAAGASAGATSISVTTASGPLWSTTADDYPFEISIGGARCRATACSDGTSPQTITVDALPVARSAGDPVALWDPRPLGL